jgi:hypothetical protein
MATNPVMPKVATPLPSLPGTAVRPGGGSGGEGSKDRLLADLRRQVIYCFSFHLTGGVMVQVDLYGLTKTSTARRLGLGRLLSRLPRPPPSPQQQTARPGRRAGGSGRDPPPGRDQAGEAAAGAESRC